MHDGALSQEDRPINSLYHVNYYRSGFFPAGMANANAAANVDVEETTWGDDLNHWEIDGDPNVQFRVKNGWHGPVDPQHDGLTEKTSR